MADRPAFTECDFHTHTEYSGEAQSGGFTLERLFQTADRLGLKYVGYSEHWHKDTPRSLFLRIRDEVDRLASRYRVKVFVSAEIDCLNSRGDLSVDPVSIREILDYVGVAISHYGVAGAEQLRPDLVEDTMAMIAAVCNIEEVTVLMHPQIVYGRSVDKIDRVIGQDEYAQVARQIKACGKVVDYASLEMSEKYLNKLGYSSAKLQAAALSTLNYSKALVAEGVWISPGSDAHNELYWDASGPWFGNNQRSWETLNSLGFDGRRLWYNQDSE